MADNSWTQFGKTDPYFAVITHDEFKSQNLNDQTLDEFFQLGERDISHVIGQLQSKFGFEIKPEMKAMDFGCGTGRLVIPLARRFAQVTGIDIAQPMLEEAKKNLQKRSITNVKLVQSNDITQYNFDDQFDLVHTYIVLQHMPVASGYKTMDKMIALTKPGGHGVIHFTFSDNLSPLKRKLKSLKNQYSLSRGLWNLLTGKAYGTPVMQMNNYNLERVMQILVGHNIKDTYLEFTDHNHLGLRMYFKK